ncbi:organic cation transporter protein-like isoform X2 [Centruroides vittatus]|uniref:organic cation transporter protein-like isoform X2 n=1 Tax=Centruroides vittatus TaxID=120091 RepID=UPI00350FC3FB
MKGHDIEPNELQETKKYEDFIDLIGGFRKWQKMLTLILVCTCFTSAINNMNWPFLAPRIDYWCARPPKYFNLSVEEWKNISAPTEIKKGKTVHSQCQVYDLDRKSENLSKIPCSSWEYDHSVFKSSIIGKWNLVCDDYWMASFSGSSYFMGLFVSALIIGQLSDRYGRRPVIMFGIILHILSGLLCTISPFYWMFTACRFLTAVGKNAFGLAYFVYVLEVVGPNYRENVFVVACLSYTTGMLSLVAVSWLVKDWFYIQLYCSLPPFVLLLLTRFIPESPRWLLAQGKLHKAEKVIERIMKTNKIQIIGLTEIIAELHFKIKLDDKKTRRNFLDLFKKRGLRKITFITPIMWLIIKFNLYALSLNPDIAGGNIFILFSIFCLLNYFACGVLYIILHRFNRKRIEIFLCILNGILSLLIIAVPQEYPWLRVVFIVSCRFFTSLASATLTGFTTELFPTVVRSVGLGLCSTFSRFGIVLAPFMKDLSVKVDWKLPFIIVGVLMIITGFGVIPLPETKNTRLKDTIQHYSKKSAKEETSLC